MTGKVFVSCAVTGSGDTASKHPDLPKTPKQIATAAIEAAKIVEKVRINPGNYADKKKFLKFEYTDNEYHQELDRIYKKMAHLAEGLNYIKKL